MHARHIIFRSAILFPCAKIPTQIQESLGKTTVKGSSSSSSSSASATCAKWGSEADPPRRLHHHSTTLLSLRRTFTPLVMSTHKAEESPTKPHNGMANGFGPKTPFLIGVAGGTASGKVRTDDVEGQGTSADEFRNVFGTQ